MMTVGFATILTETLASEKKNPRTFDFLSVELRKRKRKKISGILFSFVSVACCCSLHLPQHGHYENKCEAKSGGFYLPFHYERESKINLQIFICNHFRADGKTLILVAVALGEIRSQAAKLQTVKNRGLAIRC